MSWISIVPSALSFLGGAVKGFFGVQESKIESINKAVEVLNNANISAAEREKAVAAVVSAEASSGYWLAAAWRPLLMLGLAVTYFLHLYGVFVIAPTEITALFELLKIGVMGYMPLRTVEKLVDSIMKPKIIAEILKNIKK